MAKVFTPQWIAEMSDKYNLVPDYQRPSIYFLATTEIGRILREQIESWVATLPEETFNKVVPKLRSERGFQHTYHELAVGQFLKEHGFIVEYDKSFHGLTPDWYVHQGPHTTPFLVEVFTDEISKTRDERIMENALAD